MNAIENFRTETRAWLEANCPPSKRGAMSEGDHCFGGKRWVFKDEAQLLWLQRMAARGWTAPEWPTEHGGGGLDAAQATVLREEMERIEAHAPLTSLGIWMLGPALLKFGTEAQKKLRLPPIVRGEIRWCQGYSEPNAGSDLVSLQTRAEAQGDEYVINGQKIWTSYGHLSDAMFCLVRTDPAKPRHQGISFLLIDDMTTPGLRATPLRLISGAEHFSQVFFDDVRVPKENLVGTLDRGWDVAKYLLQFERAAIGAVHARMEAPAEVALQRLGFEALRAEPMLRAEVAELDLELAGFDALLERYRDEAMAGIQLGAKASLLKYYASELDLRRQELTQGLTNGAAQELSGPGLRDATDWLTALSTRIGGGTSEIQLNIIAKRVLELPDG
jgi:alkylation response protein AidB-like acyl-CoA dehydrogenase